MGLRTPMYDIHLALGAKMVDFRGWDMPLHYGSQVEEHHQVRNDCGVFDISHVAVTYITGADASTLLRTVLCNDVAQLAAVGSGHYSALLNEQGGIIDEVLVFKSANGFRCLTNAATRDRVQDWLQNHAQSLAVELNFHRDLCVLAIQGPQTFEHLARIFSSSRMAQLQQLDANCSFFEEQWFFSRTGYTGEEGIEIILPHEQAVALFNEIVGAGIAPIGLGARDTLRLEAGFCLQGNDMDETTTPLVCGLASRVCFADQQRQFIGKAALQAQQAAGNLDRMVGLVLEERGVLRAQQPVRISGYPDGIITSGSFSPTLGKAIALARVAACADERGEVEIRNKWHPVRVVKPCFVKHGEILI